MTNTIYYELGSALYANVTNACTNSCTFCLRDTVGVGNYDLWLNKEPDLNAMLKELENYELSKYTEFVFCGFGEPLFRLSEVLEIAKQVKKTSSLPVRINTNGHANLIHKCDITPKLEGLIDVVSISLNAKDAKGYNDICKPVFGTDAFCAVIDFAKGCKLYVPRVIFTVVSGVISDEDIKECRLIADNIGVEFRVREFNG